MSTSGVYKLIRCDRLPAIRRSGRKLRVPRIALDAYKRRLAGEVPGPPPPIVLEATFEESLAEFERETKLSPAEWERRWNDDEFEDSAENMSLAIRALSLLLREDSCDRT